MRKPRSLKWSASNVAHIRLIGHPSCDSQAAFHGEQSRSELVRFACWRPWQYHHKAVCLTSFPDRNSSIWRIRAPTLTPKCSPLKTCCRRLRLTSFSDSELLPDTEPPDHPSPLSICRRLHDRRFRLKPQGAIVLLVPLTSADFTHFQRKLQRKIILTQFD